ncbi:MAG TPA: ATP-binding protein [Leptolyngbyaceae cyanobacterium]
MNANQTVNWQVANQRYLEMAIGQTRAALQQYIARSQGQETVEVTTTSKELDAIAATMSSPPAVETLCDAFNLTPFERYILLMCAGVELSYSFAQLCATAQGNSQLAYPTFSLALAAFPDAHWSALTPAAPLRRWRSIEVATNESLIQSRLRIDERVLHYLTGISYLDDRLQGMVQPLTAIGELPPSHQAIAEQIAANWSQTPKDRILPVIQLCGEGAATSKIAIAAAACTALGVILQVMNAADIPVTVAEREALARLWEREAALSDRVLLIDCEDGDSATIRVVLSLLEQLQSLLIVATREPLTPRHRPTIRIDVNKPSSNEQKLLWKSALGSLATQLNGQLATVATQFNLSPPAIHSVSLEILNEWEREPTPHSLSQRLWNACRVQARSRLENLAQRIESTATWEDLVLPEPQRQLLQDMAASVRQRAKVYENWGFARKDRRGLGISALFSGASGTGKTMAAEVLANELQLELYRIDLSAVVSKYIGETEKNLRRVFDAAETGGAILLFDEADALFGKRSEVKDSHDRYANIEVSYLLQRMEAYRGLAILTTNLKSALDTAFLRRIRFVVQFPFPDVAQRQEIWRRIFPIDTPTEGLDLDKLARLNVAGGNIRNIALNAAFLAADTGKPVQMRHLLRAARCEYAKLEKQLADAEIVGWI